MTCDHVVAFGGDYDGSVELLRQSELPTRIEQCNAARVAWANGRYANPDLAAIAKAETSVESFLRQYTVCRYCPECGEKLQEIS